MVAVDAGVHLSAIERILESCQPPGLGSQVVLPHKLKSGAFAGLELPHATPAANAAHVARNLIDTYLITHPHLDHISGFVINTAGLTGTRPKKLAGLPSTINAFKNHIFNNIIWPNLSDENNGAGLVTYMRLVEGGSPMGEEGYLEISDGLAVKTWGVSHGHCIERHTHRGSVVSHLGNLDVTQKSMSLSMSMSAASPQMFPVRSSVAHSGSIGPSSQSYDGYDGSATPVSTCGGGQSVCVYDSCAYFIRDVATSREVLIFGDVEPDSISLSPRNFNIWQEAAPKVASGKLAAILIECSYDDSRSDERLFGHLIPRYLMEELGALAIQVEFLRKAMQIHNSQSTPNSSLSISQGNISALVRKKRKRGTTDLDENVGRQARHTSLGAGNDDLSLSPKSQSQMREMRGPTSNARSTSGNSLHVVETCKSRRGSGTSNGGIDTPHIATPTAELTLREFGGTDSDMTPPILHSRESMSEMGLPPGVLQGLKIVVIHVKDRQDDQCPIGEVILSELQEHEKTARFGCEFILSYAGQSLYL